MKDTFPLCMNICIHIYVIFVDRVSIHKIVVVRSFKVQCVFCTSVHGFMIPQIVSSTGLCFFQCFCPPMPTQERENS